MASRPRCVPASCPQRHIHLSEQVVKRKKKLYHTAAALVVLFHLAFIDFVALSGALALRWRWVPSGQRREPCGERL